MLPGMDIFGGVMARLKAAGAALLAASVMGGAAWAQGAAPITSREVVGDWRLAVTPADREDVSITFKARDGGRKLDFPLTVAAQANGRLACVLDGEPAECRIRDGRLVVVMAQDGFRMTFTLTDRMRGGFSGAASMRVRLLPIDGSIGAVTMARR